MRVLCFATTNPHKVREVRGLLAGVPVRVETLAPIPAGAEPEETAVTFEGNARIKALHYAARTARFICALVVARDGAVLFESRGVVEGRIAHAPAGDEGFGYDPIFFSPALGCTLAEAGDAKGAVSHRAQAVAALVHWVRDLK